MPNCAELKGYNLATMDVEELEHLLKRELRLDIDSELAKEIMAEIDKRSKTE